MDFKNTEWKTYAKIVGILLVISIISNAFGYYRYRYSNLSEFIPEWAMIQAARPYLVGIIASTIATITAGIFYYFAKYKITIGVGLLSFVFEYVNLNFIGESWRF
jgi:hypothetical protein